MKALIIDPFAQTITPALMPNPREDLEGVRRVIGGAWFDFFRLGHTMWFVNENGLSTYHRHPSAHWRIRLSTPLPVTERPYAGRAVVCGLAQDDNCTNVQTTAQEMASIIDWTAPPDDHELLELVSPRIIV